MTQKWIQGNCVHGVGWTKEVWLTTLQLAQPSSLPLGFVSRPGPVFDVGSSRGQAEGPDSNVAGEKQIVTFLYHFSSA